MEEEARQDALRRSKVNHSGWIHGGDCVYAPMTHPLQTCQPIYAVVAVVAESLSAYSTAASFPALFG